MKVTHVDALSFLTILIKFPTNFITAVCAFCYKILLHSISVVTLAAKTIRSDFFCGIKKQGSKSITLLLPRYSYLISPRLFFVVVMTAVVAVATVKVKVKPVSYTHLDVYKRQH